MASSSISSTLDSSDETLNGTKLMRLILDGGTEALRIVFKRFHPGSLQATLSRHQPILSNLKNRKVLNQIQWDTLYPTPCRLSNINDFDITLLSVLLRSICGLTPPSSGWDNMPNTLDDSVVADVVRIKLFRNKCFAHGSKTAIPADDFKKYWAEISLPLIRLGVDQGEIDRLENEKCGPDEIARVLKEWIESDKKICISLQNLEIKVSENNNILKVVKNDVKKLGLNELQTNSVLNKFLVHFDFKREIEFYLCRYVIGTRHWVLEQVTEWFHDENSKHRAFVISCLAGMGKSVVAAVICDKFEKNVAYCHFIQYNNSQYNNPNFLLQSLAWHLCQVFPAYKVALVEKLSGNLGRQLNEMDIEGLFSILLKELLTDIEEPKTRLLIVLDAVDESEYYGRDELANLIANHFHKLPAYICFVITARPEKKLLDKFSKLNPLFIEVDDKRNLNDIKLVLQKNLPCACQPDVQTRLAEKCSGLMLYAYFLTEVYQDENFDESQTNLPGGIDEYYVKYLQRLECELGLLEISHDQFLSFLSALAIAQEPVPEAFIGSLFQFTSRLGTTQRVRNTVNSLSSLFLIQEDKSISFFHKSVRDWLVTKNKHDYIVNVKDSHDVLLKLCVEKLNDLKQQSVTCELPKDVALRYALKHCIVHLLHGNIDEKKMECFVTDYATDLQVMFAGVHFDIDITVNNLYMLTRHYCFQNLSEGAKFTLSKLLLLLRKSGSILYNYPQTFLQSVVNEGGEELSSKASILLQTRYKNFVYLECFNKHEKGDIFDVRCHLSGTIVSIDISANHDYVVCVYCGEEIELFSLTTGRSEWRKRNCLPSPVHYKSLTKDFSYRRAVFHPYERLILPGKLDKVLTYLGTVITGPFQTDESVSEFTHYCFSSDRGKMATFHCMYIDRCMLIVWDILSGVKEICFHDVFLTSCSFTASGNYLGATDLHGEFIICNLTKDYEVKSKMIPKSHGLGLPKIISSYDQNSWLLCYYCHLYTSPNDDRIEVVNCDFSQRLVRYSSFIWTLHLPSSAHVCNNLQSFIESHDEYWFSNARIHIQNSFGWTYHAVVRYLLMDDNTLAVFSPQCNTMYIVRLENLGNSKKKISKKTRGFSAISNNGNVVYLSGNEGKSLSICHVSPANRRVKSFNKVKLLSLVVVRNGVVLFKDNHTVKLWNSDLTKRLSSFDELTGALECLSVSEEIIACVVQSSLVFFNVFSRKIISRIDHSPVRSVLACSAKYHVLIRDSSQIRLVKNNTEIEHWREVLEENVSSGYNSCIIPALFSPQGDKLVLSMYWNDVIYIFNVDKVQFLGQVPIHGLLSDVWRLNFFGNEKLVCCRYRMTYLIEVEKLKILTCLDVGNIPDSMSVCQERQIICLGYESSEKFEIIRSCWQS